jgi:hypothetical protein
VRKSALNTILGAWTHQLIEQVNEVYVTLSDEIADLSTKGMGEKQAVEAVCAMLMRRNSTLTRLDLRSDEIR